MEIHDLPARLREIRASDEWKAGKRSARTLLKEDGLRLTLAALPSGATVSPHRAEGPISVLVLEGRIRFVAGEEETVLDEGRVLTLPAGLLHSLEALEDAAVLVTVGAGSPRA